MALITWHLHNGRRISAEVRDGDSLMLAATFEDVPGIDGDCGGSLSCGTCHVVVDPAWAERVGPPGPEESELLNSTPAARQANSRLSCQILARADLDGLQLVVPRPRFGH
ncbi:MAG: 2Fe-2S iron-sulfur cluster binding domain-containing protein [Rubrivivax sp.]|nr:2Fe-2S iron-sulfur cluster binding domain-containing protein [Rubrivivax sp.]